MKILSLFILFLTCKVYAEDFGKNISRRIDSVAIHLCLRDLPSLTPFTLPLSNLFRCHLLLSSSQPFSKYGYHTMSALLIVFETFTSLSLVCTNPDDVFYSTNLFL
jgi:hypothetical protein